MTMDDTQLLKFVGSFRAGILNGRSSDRMCFMVCAPLETLLNLHGVNCKMVVSDLGECEHVFLKLEDGRVLDPTGDQFNYLFPDLNMPKVYLGPVAQIHKRWVALK